MFRTLTNQHGAAFIKLAQKYNPANPARIVSFSSQRPLPSKHANLRPPPPSVPPYFLFALGIPTAGGLYAYYKYLDEVPLTGRQRWIATSPAWERSLGDQEYKSLLRQYKNQILPKDHRASVTVHRVGKRIHKAAIEFSKQHNLEGNLEASSQPTFTVIRSDMANAFVLPNNHIFVMTGLFKFARTEDELAAVLGHEMAHNISRHIGEKVSGGLVVRLLANLSLLIDPSGVLFSIFIPTVGLLRELPHSRIQEGEADRIGMHLAAIACYDPQAAQRVFLRMKQAESSGAGRQPPEFLSTHPSHDSRVTHMEDWLPETRKLYGREGGLTCEHIRQEMQDARTLAAQRQGQREKSL